MPNPNMPALNDDGTPKDARDMEWPHSLSDKSCPITLTNPKKCKGFNSPDQQTSDSKDDILPGLKNKAPAKQVSGK